MRAAQRAAELLGGLAFIQSPDVGYLLSASRALAFHPPSRGASVEALCCAFDGTLGRWLMWLRDLLRERAQRTPDQEGYVFLGRDGEVAERLDYGELDERARAVAAMLRERLRPAGACCWCSIAASSSSPLSSAASMPDESRCRWQHRGCAGLRRIRLLAVCRSAEVELVLTEQAVRSWSTWSDLVPAHTPCACLEDVLASYRGAPERLDGACDVAFLQYTSGSTSDPKGVVVTYDALADNLRQIQRRFGHSSATRGVSWLPVHHDMGLVGCILEPMHSGFRAVLMAPMDFVQRPVSWLRAISRYGAETSGGPTFAYDCCTRRITDAQLDGVRLDSWSVAFVGAEPVRGEVLEAFARRFAAWGFRRSALYPATAWPRRRSSSRGRAGARRADGGHLRRR